jgi:hypothetical protein
MFTLPSSENDTEGCSDKNPVRLEGVKADEFQALMKAMMWGATIMNLTLR